MKSPAEFWNDEVGQSALNDFTPREPYIKVPLDDDGVNVFNRIALYICKISSKRFLEYGFVDLDFEWMNNPDETIKAWREDEALQDYETPYSGRRAYQFKIPCQKLKDKDGKRTGIFSFGDIKATKSGNWYMYGLVNLFHNIDLGWTPDFLKPKTKKAMVEGELVDVVIEGKEEFVYQNCSCFIEHECGKRLLKRIAPELKENPNMTQFYIYLMGLELEKGEYNNKPSHNYNVDDYIIME